MRNQKFISFEEGWETLLKGITKLHRFLEGLEPTFTLDEHIKLYSTVYELCIQEYIIPRDYARELYVKYRETCEEYIVSKIDQKLAGEKIDHTFVINTLDFYIKFYKCTKKDKAELCQQDLSKKINLRSSDGTVFEIDYGVALMSKRFEDITETISVGDKVDDFSVHKVSSKILIMVVEYCKKRRSYYEQMNRDDRFVKVDPKTLLDLTACACYMKIESLEKLTWSKVYGLIKGKTPEEIAQIFGDVDDSNSKLLEENIQRIESLEM
ncbi:uncharacterized protein LOC127135098 isoform X2 [Lathyrus oleraceus]|uniref:SKP1 component POZ domain-containing protein n=1 Tax=Pisum sativum TaxID=3888 RepID=A0A9D4X6Q2_PEA|nr:uncharacterized protein LOC127135098 isoform X2 [Pisum sativum]KAI5414627.1 hypothetical protein KIW84_040199 [Pisum sativum]